MASLISYAQNFEDVMLWRALKHVKNGRYIDVGAQGPDIDSVSKFFHEQGWRGIHVEPTPHYAAQLREARPKDIVLQAALGNKVGTLKFYEFPDTGLSTSERVIAKKHLKGGFPGREIVVPCITLDDVFSNFSGEEIHWLKIDVEGGEQRVLKGWAYSNARPWIVLIESTLPLTQVESHGKWEGILLSKGYEFAYFDGLNRFYVAGDHTDLLAAFTAGPNLFDGFLLSRNSWPWCTGLSIQIHAAEEKIEIERQSAAAQLMQREAEFQAMLDTSHAEAEQKHAANIAAREELATRLVVIQQSAFDTARALVATEETLNAKLVASQVDLIGRAQQMAEREREFAKQLQDIDLAFRAEISCSQADLGRYRALLFEKENELTAALNTAEREKLKYSQQLELSEQKLEFQLASRSQELATTISRFQADLTRVGELLTAKQLECELLMQGHKQELLDRSRAQELREHEFLAQMLAARQIVEKEKIDTVQVHDVQVRALTQEHAKRESSFSQSLQSLQQELNVARRDNTVREQNFSTQLMLIHRQAEAENTVKRQLHDEQLRQFQDQQAIRERTFTEAIQTLQHELRVVEQEKFHIERAHAEQSERLRREGSEERQAMIQREQETIEQMRKTQTEILTRLSAQTDFAREIQFNLVVAQNEAQSLRESWSWRITAPMRSLFGVDKMTSITTVQTKNRQNEVTQNNSSIDTREKQIIMTNTSTMRNSALLSPSKVNSLLAYDGKAFVENAFEALLGRQADSEAVLFYVDRVHSGTPKIQVLNEIGNSDEAIAHLKTLNERTMDEPAPVSAALSVAELLSHHEQAFISCAYKTILGRYPDHAGLSNYLLMHRNGAEKVQILAEILASDESKATQKFFYDLVAVANDFERTKLPLVGRLFNRLASDLARTSAGKFPADNKLALSAEVTSVAALFSCDDSRFVDTLYKVLLGREPDSQGADSYLLRLQANTPRSQLVSEIFRSGESIQRQGLLLNLNSTIDLHKKAQVQSHRFNKPNRFTKIVRAISRWPYVGRLVNVAIVLARLSRLNYPHDLLAKEDLPRLVQQHLDFDRLHNCSALDEVRNFSQKYAVLNHRFDVMATEQLPKLLQMLSELKEQQHILKTEELPNLLQRLSDLKHQQHVMETVHLPNLLQTVSGINHRQVATDHAKENLIKVVPIALRKLTRDVNELVSRTDNVAKR